MFAVTHLSDTRYVYMRYIKKAKEKKNSKANDSFVYIYAIHLNHETEKWLGNLELDITSNGTNVFGYCSGAVKYLKNSLTETNVELPTLRIICL